MLKSKKKYLGTNRTQLSGHSLSSELAPGVKSPYLFLPPGP